MPVASVRLSSDGKPVAASFDWPLSREDSRAPLRNGHTDISFAELSRGRACMELVLREMVPGSCRSCCLCEEKKKCALHLFAQDMEAANKLLEDRWCAAAFRESRIQ
eukprot:3175599-Amphidinium_carterae.1